MKIVYVGDNRTRYNFGCRATSTALSQIISQEHEIVGVIYGTYTNVDTGELFFYKHYPSWLYKWLGKRKYWKQLKSGLYLVHRFLKKGHYYFSNFDFINYDLEQSIDNFIRCLPANPHLKDFDLRQYDFDALVVNGEGSFIFATPPWRECLIEMMFMYWAQKLGKKVYFLNGMLSDDPYSLPNQKTIQLVNDIFQKSTVIGVREFYSYKYAEKNFPNINLKYFPDALFSWYDIVNDGFDIPDGKYILGMSNATNDSFNNFDFTKPYVCISGSSSAGLATKDETKLVNTYIKLVEKVKHKMKLNTYLVEVCEGDEFLRKVSEKTNTPLIPKDTPIVAAAKILSKAEVYISGRYHPSIMASLGGTPCVFMSSNSHKTKSIQEILEYPEVSEFSVLPSNKEIDEIVDLAINRASDKMFRKKIKKRCRILSKQTIKQKEVLK